MNLIDRYISRLFLTYFVVGLAVFVTLFLAVDAMNFAVRNSDAGAGPLIRYYLYYLPTVIYQMVPVACLMSTVFTVSALNKSNELVALYSVGMGLLRVSVPILVLVAVISVLAFGVNDQVFPRLAQRKNYVEYVEIKKRPGLYSTVNTNKIWYRSENVLFNIKTLDALASKAQGLTLYYFDAAWNLVQLITAKSVDIKGTQWELHEGTVTLFVEDTSFPLTKSFPTKTVVMNEDVADIQTASNSSEVMSLNSLSKFIARNKEAGLDTLRYEVDYYAKFGFASAALVMSLLGLPFSVRRQRSGGHALSIGLCLALAFSYWTLYSSGVTMGQHGAIPPVLAALGPSVFMAGVAAWLLLRLKQ
ncbi:MAG: LPS export ABC transporter permease LptG [Bdellovibrionales bacterium]